MKKRNSFDKKKKTNKKKFGNSLITGAFKMKELT